MIKSRSELHTLIDLTLPGAEVGVAEGRFSLEILQWGISKLYLVDLWQETPSIRGMAAWPQAEHDKNFTEAQERVKAFGNVVFMKGLSSEMAKQIPDKSLGFVYIDACHYYQYVLEDLATWVPKLVPGGLCAMHDYLNMDYEVKKAVTDFTKGKYKVNLIPEQSVEFAGCWFKV